MITRRCGQPLAELDLVRLSGPPFDKGELARVALDPAARQADRLGDDGAEFGSGLVDAAAAFRLDPGAVLRVGGCVDVDAAQPTFQPAAVMA